MIDGTDIYIYTPLAIMLDTLMHDAVLYSLGKHRIIRYKLITFVLLPLVQLTNHITLKFRNISKVPVYLDMCRYGLSFHRIACRYYDTTT